MNVSLLLLSLLLTAFPTAALAVPSDGEYYRYWAEGDVVAYVAAGADSYQISGRYVAVLTLEEIPRTGQTAIIGELFDCADSNYALAEMIEYGGNGLEIKQFSNADVKKSFRPVEVDTRQEFLLIGVCSEETGHPYELGAMRAYFKMIDESLRSSD